jgi:hypothetical protein
MSELSYRIDPACDAVHVYDGRQWLVWAQLTTPRGSWTMRGVPLPEAPGGTWGFLSWYRTHDDEDPRIARAYTRARDDLLGRGLVPDE